MNRAMVKGIGPNLKPFDMNTTNFSRTWLCLLLVSSVAACGFISSPPLRTERHAEESAYAADISADGQYAVVSAAGTGVTVWRLSDNQKMYQWQHQGDGDNLIIAVRISADNAFVVSADREAFALWDMASGEPVGFWRIDESNIRDIAVSNQGRGILVARSNGKVMFFEPETSRRLEFMGHQEKVNSIALSPNGKYALTGGNDYLAYLWSTDSGQVIHSLPHSSRVSLVAMDNQGRFLFSADSQDRSQIWDAQTGQPITELNYLSRQKIFTDAVFSDDGRYLLTGSPARRVTLWDLKTGDSLAAYQVAPKQGSKPPSAVVYAVGFTQEGHILSESSSGNAEWWPFNRE